MHCFSKGICDLVALWDKGTAIKYCGKPDERSVFCKLVGVAKEHLWSDLPEWTSKENRKAIAAAVCFPVFRFLAIYVDVCFIRSRGKWRVFIPQTYISMNGMKPDTNELWCCRHRVTLTWVFFFLYSTAQRQAKHDWSIVSVISAGR